MPDSSARQFLRDLDKKLWTAADRLRANLDAAVYKHAVLGLIFLKYVSDSFAVRQQEVETLLRDPKSDYFLAPADFSSLIDLVATIPFEHADLHAKDILGHVYEYFLGQFALAEGKQGGQFFTPKAIVTLIVEMLEPYSGTCFHMKNIVVKRDNESTVRVGPKSP
jgi:type I restriction-modification system DNA methylase subunit